MIEGGKRLKEVVNILRLKIKPGVTTRQIDSQAEELINKMGGEPSFKRVKGYTWSTCISLNEQIVHTPPSGRIIADGDMLTIDIGMYYKGFHTDFAYTLAIGSRDKKVEEFLQTGKKALRSALAKAKKGRRLGEISYAIETEVKSKKYSVVRELTGHGIGRKLHEDPMITGYVDIPIDKTIVIKRGLVIAIEVIYAMGRSEMEYEHDSDWSIKTADGSLSACFEKTVAITDTKTIILT